MTFLPKSIISTNEQVSIWDTFFKMYLKTFKVLNVEQKCTVEIQLINYK